MLLQKMMRLVTHIRGIVIVGAVQVLQLPQERRGSVIPVEGRLLLGSLLRYFLVFGVELQIIWGHQVVDLLREVGLVSLVIEVRCDRSHVGLSLDWALVA